jgi:AmmeMemoRadiSam system protein B
MATVRPPAVAGTFYPADAAVLDATVRSLLSDARAEGPRPLALIAPHAGYVYSGPVAASAYALLEPWAGEIRRVLLLGPCHRVPVRGLAATSAEGFRTPLGLVPVDREGTDTVLGLPQVEVFDAAHRDEHALEVHLPFLQDVLEDFSVIPLVVGDASDEEVAEVIRAVWDPPRTLVVVSSDLSHFYDYETARSLDGKTSRAIENLDPTGLGPESACGRIPARGLLLEAKRRGLRVTTVDLRNSGDTAGPRNQVVGYGAYVFHE